MTRTLFSTLITVVAANTLMYATLAIIRLLPSPTRRRGTRRQRPRELERRKT